MLQDINSVITSDDAQSPCTEVGTGLEYYFLCHFPEENNVISKEREIHHLY